MRAHIIQIVGRVYELGIVPLLACEIEIVVHGLEIHWQIVSESRKWLLSTIVRRNLLPSFISCGAHSFSETL